MAYDEVTAQLLRENERLRAAFADLETVRDRIAMAAMTAMLAAGHDKPMRGYEGWREEFCAESYRWADAMLAVRGTTGVGIPLTGQEKDHG